MSPFTPSELAFLRRHNFSEDEVHDGRGQGKYGRELRAKQAGKILVLTNTRCRAMGHRIRTRAGHCAQCNPTNIAFTARETSSGNVYIAGSLSGRVIKIGMTTDIARRQRQLRAQQYGGFSDWRVLFDVHVNDAGAVERAVSSRTIGKRVYGGYFKDGNHQMAIEVIQCSFSAAFKAFAEATGGFSDRVTAYYLKHCQQYEFEHS